MTLAELNVKITADVGKLQDELDKVKKKLKDTDDVTTKSQKTVGGLVDKFKSLSIAGLGVSVAIGALITGLKKSIAAAAESEAITAKLNQVLISTGEIAGVTSQEALDLADSLSQVTTFEDDVIVSAETMLLAFKQIGEDVFPKATEAVLDFATFMKTDVQSAAMSVGKALNDPIQGLSTLRRVGIQFTDSQEQQVKAFMEVNDVASAQKIILDELASKMGGQARAEVDTYSGRMKQLKNSMGEFSEAIGKMLLPVLSTLIPELTKAANQAGTFIDNLMKGAKLSGTKDALENVNDSIARLEKRYEDLNKQVQRVGYTKELQKGLYETKEYLKQLYESRKKIQADLDVMEGRVVATTKKNQAEITTVTQEESDKQKAIKEKQHQDSEKMAVDYTTKILQQKGQENALLYQQGFTAMEQVKALSTLKSDEKERLLTNITTFYANERKRIEFQKAQESAQAILTTVSGMIGQLSGLYSMYYSNKALAVDNDTYKQIDSLTRTYEAEKANIEATVLDEEEKKKQLAQLEQDFADDKKGIETKADKEKRKMQRDAAETSKKLAIFETLLAIPQAAFQAYKALAGIPYVGPVLGAIAAVAATGLGIAKLALIKNQPLPAAATGGVFNTPYVGGEAGAEMALPLEGINGQNAIKSFSSGLLDAMSENFNTDATSGQSSSSSGGGGNVYLDGSLVGKWISKTSNNGGFTLNNRVII